MKLPKFDKAKVKEAAVVIGIAVAFFAIPVTYYTAKERAFFRNISQVETCVHLGPPPADYELAPFIKDGFRCGDVIIAIPK